MGEGEPAEDGHDKHQSRRNEGRNAPRRSTLGRRHKPIATASTVGGTSAYEVPLVRIAAAVRAQSAVTSRTGARRLMTRVPIHSASVHSGTIRLSGLTLAPMKVSIGSRPQTAAAVSWAGRRRPSASPARSQPASALMTTSSALTRRIVSSWLNALADPLSK